MNKIAFLSPAAHRFGLSEFRYAICKPPANTNLKTQMKKNPTRSITTALAQRNFSGHLTEKRGPSSAQIQSTDAGGKMVHDNRSHHSGNRGGCCAF